MNRDRAPQKKLPAFGRPLLELRRKGLVPSPAQCLVCLDSWRWGVGRGRTRVVVAQDADPSSLDFSMLAGLDCIVAFDPGVSALKRRDDLLRALVRANPLRLFAMNMDSPRDSFFVKSVAVGVERREYA